MSEVGAITNLNINHGCGYDAGSLRTVGINGEPPVKNAGWHHFGVDYFESSTNTKGAKNPVFLIFDEYLARFSPETYLNKYANERVLTNAVEKNPEIERMLAEKGLTPEIHMENISGKARGHFMTTYAKAKEVGKNLPVDEYSALLQAALLHDLGKAFIPPEILNKPGKLTPEEREIVDLHAKLGAEVLKTTDVSPKVTESVRLHHSPYTDPNKQNNMPAQILSAADVYSALKEERPYKKPFSDEQVKDIMQSDKKLNPDIVNKIVSQNGAFAAAG